MEITLTDGSKVIWAHEGCDCHSAGGCKKCSPIYISPKKLEIVIDERDQHL